MTETDALERIRKINKNIVNKNGEIDSFGTQLINLLSGEFDVTKPMVITGNSNSMSYIDKINPNCPLVINVSTFIKIQNKHSVPLNMINSIENMLKESVLAFESLTEDESIIILTNRNHDLSNDPYIISCRYEKKVGVIQVNEITSFYDKQRFQNFLINTYEQNKTIYKNKKTEQYFNLNRLQLPQELIYALSNYYDRLSFNKSQVELDGMKERQNNQKERSTSIKEKKEEAKQVMVAKKKLKLSAPTNDKKIIDR